MKSYPQDLVFSMDLESTGLHHEIGQPYMTQFALVPVNLSKQEIQKDKGFEILIQCPPVEEMKESGRISKFVLKNKNLLQITEDAAANGLSIKEAKTKIGEYLCSFKTEDDSKNIKAIFLGKSIGGLDRRLMGEVFSDTWLDKYVHYRMIDTTSNLYLFNDLLEDKSFSVLEDLEKKLNFREADHTALQDAVDTAEQYFQIINLIKKGPPLGFSFFFGKETKLFWISCLGL